MPQESILPYKTGLAMGFAGTLPKPCQKEALQRVLSRVLKGVS